MSIADQLALIPPEIDRLEAAKDALVAAIIGKGVNVPADTLLDALDAYVAQIKTGADVSGVTTAVDDVLAGKKFVGADGVLREGTIPSKTAATYTPKTTDQTIAAGQYLKGAQTIKGDTNLVAANIKKGISIFGVAGNVEAEETGMVVSGQILASDGTITISGLTFSKIKSIYFGIAGRPFTNYPSTSTGTWVLGGFIVDGITSDSVAYASRGSYYTNTTATYRCFSHSYSSGTLTISLSTIASNYVMNDYYNYHVVGV